MTDPRYLFLHVTH